MAQENTAIRKQTQIDRTNKMMFLWIAIASALVGAAVVVSIFLFQKVVYEEKVLAAKSNTATTLTKNIQAVSSLRTNIKALDANSALMSIKANPTDETLQVVLDALPSDANSLALGASLQNKLIANVSGNFTLESLQVTPVSGVEALDDTNTADASTSSTEDGAQQISFTFSVNGDQEALSGILKNIEKSIRTIVVSHLTIEKQTDGLTMTVEGHAFYLPEKTIELTEKVVSNK